jgi:class 3 adenylate cyclase
MSIAHAISAPAAAPSGAVARRIRLGNAGAVTIGESGETATFLFTDVEGSTRLFGQVGDDYPALLERHRGLLLPRRD